MDTKNDVVDNKDINNDIIYYAHQYKHKIFKHIPGNIRKNAQYINIFTYNFKPYHVAIGININLFDDYQKYKWKSLILNVGLNSDIISFDFIIVN
jgi:hypothetical protein